MPDVWDLYQPAYALNVRLAGVDAAVRAHRDPTVVTDAARAVLPDLGPLATSADAAGRPLHAANLELDEPADPHLELWPLATLFREHRGDGHIAALTVRQRD